MTPRTLITLALKQVGAVGLGQPARPEYLTDALDLLNIMLGQWAQRRWLVYQLVDASFAATGALSYSIGPGGVVDMPRVDRIEGAFARLNPGPRNDGFILDASSLDVGVLDPDQALRGLPTTASIDYSLDVLQSREDYNRIGMKAQGGFPSSIFLDSGSPLGQLYVWPLPGPQFEIHVSVKRPLSRFTDLDAESDLPDEYADALLQNLTVRLCPIFQVPLNPVVAALASAALNTVRNSNTQIPRLMMPVGLPGMDSGRGGGGGIASVAASAPALAAPIATPAQAFSPLGQTALGQMLLAA